MIDHRNLALSGLFPGLVSTRSVANLGTFDTEVIIEPVIPVSGGGYVRAPIGVKPDRYRVTVRVTINGKVYTDVQIVDDTRARVIAELRGIETFTEDDVMVSFNGVQVITSEINVNAHLTK